MNELATINGAGTTYTRTIDGRSRAVSGISPDAVIEPLDGEAVIDVWSSAAAGHWFRCRCGWMLRALESDLRDAVADAVKVGRRSIDVSRWQ